jgi:hypothetical protein
MTELELTRTPDDRRLYTLEGAGTLRLDGWFSRGATATAQAGDGSWRFDRRGLFTTVIEATDAAGALAGEFRGRTLRRGGELTWAGHELGLRPSSVWHERYALADGERELATIEGKGWGRRPVKVTVEDDRATIDPGLLLFGAFVVRTLAEDAASASGAAGGAVAATSG